MHTPGAQVRKSVHPAAKMGAQGAGCTLNFKHCRGIRFWKFLFLRKNCITFVPKFNIYLTFTGKWSNIYTILFCKEKMGSSCLFFYQTYMYLEMRDSRFRYTEHVGLKIPLICSQHNHIAHLI